MLGPHQSEEDEEDEEEVVALLLALHPHCQLKKYNSVLCTMCFIFFCRGSVFFQGGAGLAEVQGGEALVVVSSENFKKWKRVQNSLQIQKSFKDKITKSQMILFVEVNYICPGERRLCKMDWTSLPGGNWYLKLVNLGKVEVDLKSGGARRWQGHLAGIELNYISANYNFGLKLSQITSLLIIMLRSKQFNISL